MCKKSIGKRKILRLGWHRTGHDDITDMREAQEKLK